VGLLVGVAGRAAASPPLRVIGAADGCPSPAAVVAALAPLVPHLRVSTDGAGSGAPGGGLDVRVEDLGASVRVSVGEAARVTHDPARGCVERAHVVAVFVALAVAPPALSAEPPAPAAQDEGLGISRRPAAAARPVARLRATVEAFGLGLTAPAAAATPTTGGGGLRLRLGTARVGAALGCAAAAPYAAALGPGTGRITRVAVDLDLYARAPAGPIEIIGELGVSPTILHASGTGFSYDSSASGLEWGLRAALGARFFFSDRFGVAVGLEGVAVPRSVELASASLGKLGSTPSFWLGLTAGVVARLH
jgi:hypothetical protein